MLWCGVQIYLRGGYLRVANERRSVQRADQHHLQAGGIVRGVPGRDLLHRHRGCLRRHGRLLSAGVKLIALTPHTINIENRTYQNYRQCVVAIDII